MSTVIITGAAAGIGRATAIAVAKSGRNVVAWDIQVGPLDTLADECRALGVEIVVGAFDVTDRVARTSALAVALGHFDDIEGLVHAAGISGAQPISAFTPESWGQLMSVNLDTAAALTHELHAILGANAKGSIVFVSSIEGFFGHQWLPAYCASKAGLLGLARASAAELGVVGIRVNCVCPGAIETAMMAPLLAIEGVQSSLESRTPLGRLGQPEDIADVIVFLLSEKSRFVTGASLVVDGGLTSIAGI